MEYKWNDAPEVVQESGYTSTWWPDSINKNHQKFQVSQHVGLSQNVGYIPNEIAI